MNGESYLVRAVRRVFSDGTAWWRVVVLAALQLVPILNLFVTTGYAMTLMRDAAWDTDRGLPRFSEYKEVLRHGVNGFVVSLVWGLVLLPIFLIGMCAWIFSVMPQLMSGATATPPVPWWLGALISVPAAFLSVVIYVAWLRAAVYSTMTAGLSITGVRQLIRMNSKAFPQVAWLPVAAGLLTAALSLAASVLVQNAGLPSYATGALSYLSSFLTGIVSVLTTLIAAVAYGLWAGEPGPRTWPPLRTEPTVVETSATDETGVGTAES